MPQRRLSIVGTSAWTVRTPTTWRCPTSMCRRCTARSHAHPGGGLGRRAGRWSAARPLIGASGGQRGGRELSRTFKCFDHAVTDGWRGSSPSPAARRPPCGPWPRPPPTWSAPSSASRRRAAPARSCWPTPTTTPRGGMNAPRTVLLKVFRYALKTTLPATRRSGRGRAPDHRARRPPPPPAGPQPHRPALLPARLLRHLWDAGQRPRGPGLCDPDWRPGRPGGGRAPGRGGRGRRPGR